jgi:hypothetical protein
MMPSAPRQERRKQKRKMKTKMEKQMDFEGFWVPSQQQKVDYWKGVD